MTSDSKVSGSDTISTLMQQHESLTFGIGPAKVRGPNARPCQGSLGSVYRYSSLIFPISPPKPTSQSASQLLLSKYMSLHYAKRSCDERKDHCWPGKGTRASKTYKRGVRQLSGKESTSEKPRTTLTLSII